VLWDFAYGTKENVTWCRSNSSLGAVAVPVAVEGDFEAPFALVSIKEGDKIILRAVATDDDSYFVPSVCMFNEAYLEECRTQRTVGLKTLIHLTPTGSFEEHFEAKQMDDVEKTTYESFFDGSWPVV
jgi:hypothetical protein